MTRPKSTKSIVVTKSEEDNPSSRFRQTCCTGRHRPSLDGAQEERHGPACLPERRHARVGEGRHAPLLPVPACYLLRNDAPALVGTACGQTADCAARPRPWASVNSKLRGNILDGEVFWGIQMRQKYHSN